MKKRDRKETERRTLRYKKLIHESAKLVYKYDSMNPKDWGKKELDDLCQKIYKTLNPITRSRMFNMVNRDEIVKKDITDAYLKKLDENGLTEEKEIELTIKGINLIKTTSDALNCARYIREKRGASKTPQTQINSQTNYNFLLPEDERAILTESKDLSINDKTDVLKPDENE